MSGNPNRRILVVNDNQAEAESLKVFLEASGYEVQVALTGWAGLQLTCSWLPDIVLTDIRHPGPDGFLLASLLRNNKATAKVFLIAWPGDEDEPGERWRAHQFDHYLSSPGSPEELLRLLAQLKWE